MHVLITGARGQLGSDCVKAARARGWTVSAVGRDDFDLTEVEASTCVLQRLQPHAILHCAAYTAVDQAEDEPSLAYAVNAAATQTLADYCARAGAWLCYISTDYVFDGSGTRPRGTDETPEPINTYGKTKLAGERAAGSCAKHMIVRTSWVFGRGGGNFVKTMLRLGAEREEVRVVADQIGSPTYTVDLARLLCDMLAKPIPGIYHATNANGCSWADFAEEIFRQAGLPARVARIASKDYPQKAARPKNSRLSPASLARAGYESLPPWQDALKRFLAEIKGDSKNNS
ncbi:MAG: dTDP-4-dehydrorhamnose reductase [Oscillospiraceae bacterium]|jgi:dTDP-4-dehydrorhamnose reductase|nr:dTDP-4-dehydrorhamnose reductase [Oscillospiraceae bacterium]